MGITTYNPGTLEVTNKWEYSDFISVQPINRNQLGSPEFTITVRKERKNETMKFSSEHRPHLLTEALKYRNYVEKSKEILVSLHTCIYFFSFPLLFFSSQGYKHTFNSLRICYICYVMLMVFIFAEISSLQTSLV